jgi:hypothetical protein
VLIVTVVRDSTKPGAETVISKVPGDRFGRAKEPSSRTHPEHSVNSWGLQTLNALFGVAYDPEHLNPDPQLGNFWATKWVNKVSGGSK